VRQAAVQCISVLLDGIATGREGFQQVWLANHEFVARLPFCKWLYLHTLNSVVLQWPGEVVH